MSEQLTKETLVRLSWLTELRRQGERKCVDVYVEGSLVCALGLLREVAIADPRDWPDDVGEVGAFAGLSHEQSEEVASRNDGAFKLDGIEMYHPHTLSEIADVVEGWFR